MKKYLLCLLLVGCASTAPSWKWQVKQTDTMGVEIYSPIDGVLIGINKYGGAYHVNIYDKTKENCFGSSFFVTNVLVGHRHAVIEFEVTK